MDTGLRYIEAEKVDNVGRLSVRMDDDDVGDLDGLIVDPAARRVRYFVIDAGGPKYLLPLCPAMLDQHENSLRVLDSDECEDWQEFDPEEYPEFGDEDVLDFMFANKR